MRAPRTSDSPNQRWHPILTVLVAAGLLFAMGACGQAGAPGAVTPPGEEAVEGGMPPAVTREVMPRPQSEDLVTLHWSLAREPQSLDPALAADQASLDAVSNLFVGLTRYDPDTSAVLPYLATGWDVSDDGLVYTFNLRADVYWVRYDVTTEMVEAQRPVTAHDVEYGIKRAIDPQTGSSYAYPLFIIENASLVHRGEEGVTLDDVGVWALDDTAVQFTLEQPASYLPSVVGMWVAKPQPREPIEAHGDTWTEPGTMWTNGPYFLAARVPEKVLRFEKNPFWIHAEEVQIEAVEAMVVIDVSTGFALYEEGQLDTVRVPLVDLPSVRRDPILSQEIARQTVACTTYYGFTTTKPPFDDVRVRTAFSAAIDRETLIETVLEGGGQVPATSFAPPGTWGAPPPTTVGLGYDPELARAVLQEYLDETGLADPAALGAEYDIVLGYNTGESHARIAAAIQGMWADTLGVHIRVVDQDWTHYLETTRKTTPVEDAFHIFRMGWCADYPDENNWVREVFHYQEGSNRVRRRCADPDCAQLSGPGAFDQLVLRAARETDSAVREGMYARAEDILAREEVVAAYIYHHGVNTITKPWLDRDYPSADGANWYDWTIDWEAKKAAR